MPLGSVDTTSAACAQTPHRILAVTCYVWSPSWRDSLDLGSTYSAFLQVGMHGAGLVNAFFMRPGAALIEIFPCRFGDEHQRNYFWHPSHAEMQTFAFQIFITDEAACKPSELQKHPEGRVE